MDIKNKTLAYHSQGRKGKLEVIPSKPCANQTDLSLAYTPGVAWPVREIADDPSKVFEYTNKGNLVAVISNGTAILGLGNLGALASKPVMEGKGVLFKRFADVDVYDIEVASENPYDIIRVCELIAPTFGGINLEDIKGPECFYIEQTLIERLDIPVFHDDQHGTAIIAGAGILNSLKIVGKKIDQIKLVVNGAGAAGISCAKLLLRLGVKKENFFMCDSQGVIYKGRTKGMNTYKEEFAKDTNARTLKDCMVDADVFMGLSSANILNKDMVCSMAKDAIIFAMANPDPEINYDEAKKIRSDLIVATGRSDFPNQVNNVLGFPFIFRGALDVRAKKINEEMKLAAVYALAKLAQQEVIPAVLSAYPGQKFSFGKEYIIPKPFDPRVLYEVSSAVAEAAIKTGVARVMLDIVKYKEQLKKLSEKLKSRFPAVRE